MNLNGRKEKIEQIQNMLKKYNNANQSVFYNIYGRGGLGKTALVKNVFENFDEYIQEAEGVYQARYVDVSDCHSFESILLKIRFLYKNRKGEFNKFDYLYILFYGAQEYYWELGKENDMLKKIKGEDAKGELKIRQKIERNFKHYDSAIVAQSVTYLLEAGREWGINNSGLEKDIAGALLASIPIDAIIDGIMKLKTFKEQNDTIKEINKLYQEFKDCSEIQKNNLLVRAFSEGLNSVEGCTKKVIIIDNYKYNKQLENEDFILGDNDNTGMVQTAHAFWLFCSRDKLMVNMEDDAICVTDELKTLDEEAVHSWISTCENFNKLKPKNQEQIKKLYMKKQMDCHY